MDTISFDEFLKVDVRAGKILEASTVEGSNKLLKLKVDFGELGEKQVLSGIQKWYKPEELVGRTYPFVVNLPPREMMGMVSEAMIFAATSHKATRGQEAGDQEVVLFEAIKDIAPGSRLH